MAPIPKQSDLKKPEDNFMVKLTKQVKSNKEAIDKILVLLENPQSQQINKPKPQPVSEAFNLHADFAHDITVEDRLFLAQFGQDITKTLQARGVKSFVLTFRK